MKLFVLLIAVLVVTLLSRQGTPIVGKLASPSNHASTCNLYASPGAAKRPKARGPHKMPPDVPGSLANPFPSAQRLVDELHAGQTGCLARGTYFGRLVFHHGGRRGAPLTLRNVPGQPAILAGGPVYLPTGSNDVTIASLNIDLSTPPEAGVQIMGHRDALIGNDITNHASRDSCVILGSNVGWGTAVSTVIEGNVIHQCGSVGDRNEDHAIYFDNSTGALVRNNLIWGTSAFAIHLYQHAVNNVIVHNVIDNNGYGVIFAGSRERTSSGNVVAYNVIADTSKNYDVSSWWGGVVGPDNVLASNCLYNRDSRAIEWPTTGYVAVDNLIAKPEFANPAGHDYRLKRGSPCLRVVGYDSVLALDRLWRVR